MKTYLLMIRKVVLIASVFFLFFTTGAIGAIYYVATTGSDSNPGIKAEPWLTIQKAADEVVPGDTVIVQNGTYKASIGNNYVARFRKAGTAWGIGKQITFKSETPYGAVVDGNSNATAYGFQIYNNSTYIRFEGFEFKNLSTMAFTSGSTEGSNNIYIYQCKIHDIGRRTYSLTYGLAGIYTGPKTSYWTVDKCLFYNIGRNHDSFPQGSDYYHNFVHDHGWYAQGHHHILRNSIFYGMLSGWAVKIDGYNGVALTGDGWTHELLNNTFANDGNPSLKYGVGLITLYKNPGVDNKYRNVVIENNVFYNATGDEAIEVGPSGKLCGTYSSNLWPVDGNLYINNNVSNDLYLIQECLQPDCTEYNKNIDASIDPGIQKSSLGMKDPFSNDFTLTSSANYLIDAAASPNAPNEDFSGTTRFQGQTYDIGAYEFVVPENDLLESPKKLRLSPTL